MTTIKVAEPREVREPHVVADPPSRSDKAFTAATSGAGLAVFGLLVVIGSFLVLRAVPTFRDQGVRFLTRIEWRIDVTPPQLGVLGLVVGTVVVALIAITIAVPVGTTVALFITEYAGPKLRKALSGVIDLLAAIPALFYGIWGAIYLSPQLSPLGAWLTRHLSWVPFFKTDHGAAPAGTFLGAGIVVSLMIVPIVASVGREVFAQAPVGEKEAALALGSSQWGMIRNVVIPFGRGGVVGGAMLGLGRALGETIAVTLLLPQVPKVSWRILENGGGTVSGFIAQRAGSDPITVSALMAAGLVLFCITLVTNLVASVVISRSRSGVGVEL